MTEEEPMPQHIPMCPVCDEYEAGTWGGDDEFCSPECAELFADALAESRDMLDEDAAW